MSEQANGWAEAAKWLGGIAAFWGAVRSYFKARNTNHADRIQRLERESREDRRVMSEVRSQLEELNIRMVSTERRTRQIEVNLMDTTREVRDNLQVVIDKLDRRLHTQSREDNPPPASR